MGRRAGPVVFEAFKPVPLKGCNDRIHMRPGHLETARYAPFVPPFVPHADDGPARLIGIGKLAKGRQTQGQLDGQRIARQKAFDGVMIRLIPKFPPDDTNEFVVVDSPPILPFADGRAISPLVDGVILVGRSKETTRHGLVRSMELLAEVHSAPVLDIVLNAAAFAYPNYGY